MRKATRQQGGFTLIEMAIVLVIIGLIIGAVLKGQ
ncbi:MAG: prepilin-type N-terminal cleavage/methylation domain-containing protein, partial [Deltaproteobacteria bacterium]|nr:prepilin-type N-terminal cleavage/methylation domain-containing protein [Deltaproteobacteria bacterium]